MKTGSKTNKIINITGLSIILITVALKPLRYSLISESTDRIMSKLRAALYLLFFALWGITLWNRVIQKHTRLCFIGVACLEEFWILVRTLKYEFIKDAAAERYLWYLYYLPMLMIPALCLILAVSIGKPESYKPRKFLLFFPITSLVLFLPVITNDLHGKVFAIPDSPDGTEVGNYSYGTVYFLIATYIGLCTLAGYEIIFVKCRANGSRKAHFLPLIPLTAAAVICFLNVMGINVIFGFYHLDITLICCICITAALECCIQSRLILTNDEYDELFLKSELCAVITDKNFGKIISSDGYGDISEENMKNAINSPVMLKNSMRLSSAALKHGYVFWQEDISEIENVLQKLSETNDYLQGKNDAVHKAYDYRKKERRLIEQNRLYNRILTRTKPEIELYSKLIEELSKETNPEKEKSLAVKIAFVSAFIKRHDNLVFLSEEEKPIRPAELYYCVEESLSNLRLSGAECYCSFDMERPLPFEKISELYESFYRNIFCITENISSVYVYLIDEGKKAEIVMRICLRENADLSYIQCENTTVKKEDSEWLITIK